MTTLGGWCMAAPGAQKAHALCRFRLCTCDCHVGSDPNENGGSEVESETKRGPDRANESDPLATDLPIQKGA